jgi:hypothetical protein
MLYSIMFRLFLLSLLLFFLALSMNCSPQKNVHDTINIDNRLGCCVLIFAEIEQNQEALAELRSREVSLRNLYNDDGRDRNLMSRLHIPLGPVPLLFSFATG